MRGALTAIADQRAKGSFLSPLSLLILIGIGTRIFLLNWYGGEYTDGIIQLQLFQNQNAYFPPLYPAVVDLVQTFVRHPILAGRLVSLLGSTLVLIPLFHLTQRLYGRSAAIWAGVLYLSAAIPNRWALRVMSDSLFTFFFMLGIMAFLFSLTEPSHSPIRNLSVKMSSQLNLVLSRVRLRRWTYLLIASAGLATLTRYQGLALVPLIILSLWRNRQGYSKWEVVESLSAVIPWGILIWWLRYRGFGHPEQFAGRIHSTPWQTALAYWDMAETFLLYLPYALTVPVFALILLGYFSRGISSLFIPARWTFLYLLLAWFPVHAAFQSFQYRYFLPLVPLMMVFAGQGMCSLLNHWRRRNWKGSSIAASVVVIQSLTFAICVLVFQRHAFSDFTEIGELIAGQDLQGGKVYASEVYNPGNYNIKLSFWAEQPIEFFSSLEQASFKPGDYIFLSNVYNSMEGAYEVLSRRYHFEVFYQSQRYTLIPLLPDIMVYPPGATSQPLCMAYRFYPQVYYSYLIRIRDVRG